MVDLVTDLDTRGSTDENDETFIKIKEDIEDAHEYFATNYETYNRSRNYVYNSNLTDAQRQSLQSLNKPPIELNELEVNLSRMVGEWIQNEPSLQIFRREGSSIPRETINFLQDHMRYAIYQANKKDYSRAIFEEMISGGFSAAKVLLKYPSPMSMQVVPTIEKVYDPTLCYFDPMARESSKLDGGFCGEIFPFPADEFRKTFKDANLAKYDTKEQNISTVDNFSWSYKGTKENSYVLVADHYKKEKEEREIIQVSTGDILFVEDYELLMKRWSRGPFRDMQKPKRVGKPQKRLFDKIIQYLIWEYGILMKKETVYRQLPLVYFDGNSKVLTKNPKGGESYQKTRPIFYQAMGAQNLKNLAGQTLAQWMQNLTPHKWIFKEEALPTDADSLMAIKNPQKASSLVVKAFYKNNPELPIPEPVKEVVNVPLPPEVMQIFQAVDPLFQIILGGFVSNMGKPNSNLSGKAIIETQSASNPAVMPYINGYLCGLSQIGSIMLDLIPKCYKSKTSLPVKTLSGKLEMSEVNGDEQKSPSLNYNSYDLELVVEPSLSFQVQKTQALSEITSLMHASQGIDELMNSKYGLPVVVKNMTMYGADELQDLLPKFLEEKEEKQKQMMQMQAQQMQNDPRLIAAKAQAMKAQADTQAKQMDTQIKVMEMKQDAQEHAIDSQLKSAEIGVKNVQAQADIFKAQAEMAMTQMDVNSRISDDQTSQIIHSLDAASKMSETEGHDTEKALKVHDAVLKERDLKLKEIKTAHDMQLGEHKAQTDRIKAKQKPTEKAKE